MPIDDFRTTIGVLLLSALSTAGAWGCSEPPREPMRLDGNMLTVDNRTSEDWHGVEIYLNTYYRVTAQTIPAGSRFQAPLDGFVAGFGQRFDMRRMQIHSLKLTATRDGAPPLELNKQFQSGGLAGALGGKQ